MNRASRYVFFALWLAGIAIVALTASRLPDRVATHFGANGMPNGWMPRSAHMALMIALMAGIPALIAGIFACVRYLPSSLINLPNKDYWLAPERRNESLTWLANAGFWFASLEAVFFIGLHFLVLQANAGSPPKLSDAIWLMLAIMLGGVAWIIAAILRRFPRPNV